MEPYLPYIFYVVGFLARVILPYVLERLKADGPLSFDWRYVGGQLVGAVVGVIPLVLGDEYLAHIGALSWAAALIYGWGATDIGRKLDKATLQRK